MKEALLAGIAGIPLLIVSGAAATADTPDVKIASEITYSSEKLIGEHNALTIIEADILQAELKNELEQIAEQRRTKAQDAYKIQVLENSLAMESVVDALLSRVGRTWYVFGGSTPSGWDCSGMVLWAYQELGIELPHSASQQSELGMSVTEPQLGDAVFFDAGSGVYHAAMYLGDNLVIHSGFREGRKTEVISLDSPAFSGNLITYKRFIDLGN